VNEFVEACRQEWRRLGVEDAVANEMAADLTADLDEAAAEGGTAEDVLGNSAFDPRRFASDWAFARGVAGPPTTDRPSPPEPLPRWRPRAAVALTAVLAVLTVTAGLFLVAGDRSRSVAVAVHRMATGSGPIRFFVPDPGHPSIRVPFGPPFAAAPITVLGGHPIALLLFILGVVGLGLVFALYWLPRSTHRRAQIGTADGPVA
jgi:hypothetical protein